MKKFLIALGVLLAMVACNNKPATDPETKDVDIANDQEATFLHAIDQYLTTEIGSQYAEGEHCVPFHSIIDVDMDGNNTEEILVWGDFWAFNYNQVGDTLKCVSGGSHPGLMHLLQTEKGFEVTAFDQVEDGSRNISSAKEVFGEKYDDFHAINSNEQKREKLRADALYDYVQKHHLSVTVYQDYGWPARVLH